MTLYELLQIKGDYIETSDVDYDVFVGTDLVKDEDINENIETTLNEIEQANEEKNEEITR